MKKKTDTTSSQQPTNNRSSGVSRRQILKTGAPIAGALVLGAGSVGAVPGRQGAPGSGGEAIVTVSNHHAGERFEVIEFFDDDNDEKSDKRIPFQCEGQGAPISFPAWKFEYENESLNQDNSVLLMYTRDNNVDTDSVYEWKPVGNGAKNCGSPEEGKENLIQTPFIRVD